MRALVTGVAGFAGSHLAEYLLDVEGLSVAGVVRPGDSHNHVAPLSPRLRLFTGDVTDPKSTEQVLADWRPDYVFHLAGQAVTSVGWSQAQDSFAVNVLGQHNVLNAVWKHVPEAAVLVVGSAEVYGLIKPDELPIAETSPLRPSTPYAVSKLGQELLGFQFFLRHGLRTVRVRPFNHIGPRQSLAFVTASFASQIAAIEAGLREPVVIVGNLETRRDFCDVRDMVRAYWLALKAGLPGEVYNLGSGASRGIAEVLDLLVRQAVLPIRIEQDPQRLRPSDTPDLICNAGKFRKLTGWQPLIPFEQTLRDLLDYHRAQLRAQRGVAT